MEMERDERRKSVDARRGRLAAAAVLTLALVFALPASMPQAAFAADFYVNLSDSMTPENIQTQLDQRLGDAGNDVVEMGQRPTVAVYGSYSNASALLRLDIPYGVTLVWQADYAGQVYGSIADGATLDIDGTTLKFSPDGTVNNGMVTTSNGGLISGCHPAKPIGALPYTDSGTIGAGDMTLYYGSSGSQGNAAGKAYAVNLVAGAKYLIKLEKSGSNLDPYLYLNSAAGYIARDDDSGGDLNSRIIFIPTASGTYYIIATRYSSSSSGAYTLTVEEVPLNQWGDVASDNAFNPADARYAAYPSGTLGQDQNHPVLIRTAAELAYLNTAGSSGYLYYKLAPPGGVLDMSGYLWVPQDLYGSSFSSPTLFDGNGTVVTGLEITEDSSIGSYNAGLFGYVARAEVRNLTLRAPVIRIRGVSKDAAGAVAGYVECGKLRNVTVADPDILVDYTNMPEDGTAVGGIAGYAYDDSRLISVTVRGGTVRVLRTGSSGQTWGIGLAVGGIVGNSYNGTIFNAASSARVVLDDSATVAYDKQDCAGGIAGSATLYDSIATCVLNSYATGSVALTHADTNSAGSSAAYAGGLVGYLEDSAVNNYTTADVSAGGSGGDIRAGRLFGIATANADYVKGNDGTIGTGDDGRYFLKGNHYTAKSGMSAVGLARTNGAPAASFDQGAGAVAVSTQAELLTRLNSTAAGTGRSAVADAIRYHNSDYAAQPFADVLAKVETWKIVPGVNRGWPVFGTDDTPPSQDDPSYPAPVTPDGKQTSGGTTETPVTAADIPAAQAPVAPGQVSDLPKSVTFDDGTSADVIWTSADSAVARIDANGDLVAVGEGRVKLIATAKDGSGRKITISVVVAKPVTKVRTPLVKISMKKGTSLTLPVCADSVNPVTKKAETTAKLTWKSSKKKVATVNTKGKIKAKAPGTAKITATALNGRKLTVTVKVVKKAVTLKKITISGIKATLNKGGTAQIKLKVRPAGATNLKIKFKSGKSSVLKVDKAGKLTALKKGKAKITVTIGKKKAVKTITVK
jgi:uncharacterized protein YjdB